MNQTAVPLSDQVFHRFLDLRRDVRRHTRKLIDERGLTPRDLSVLRYLWETESATVGQVQAYMHQSPSTTSSLVTQLEEQGYVTRTRSDEDNRVVIVQLTSVGQELAENTPLGGLALLRRRLASLPQERLHQIDGVLIELAGLMEVEDAE